jgi:hypothetical protein
VLYALIALAGVVVVFIALHLFWRGKGLYLIRRAGPRQLFTSTHRIWRDPGPIDQLDLIHGPGGPDFRPIAPFAYVEEHGTGSQPCVSVRDKRGRRWRVKWGPEVRSETFAVRFAWACGYFAEVTHFVATGRVGGVPGALSRAKACIEESGAFIDARFELEEEQARTLFEEHSWAWNDNPFIGTRELSGLKIVVMLLSNWDTKDRRDVARGSNTAIFERRLSRWQREAQYLITDWGGSMGRWGSNIITRASWDVAGYEAQTPGFVTGVTDGCVTFGYAGQRTADVASGIPVEHARWFYLRARGLRERQLHEALMASGATDDEAARFAGALMDRIRQIGAAVAEPEEALARSAAVGAS